MKAAEETLPPFANTERRLHMKEMRFTGMYDVNNVQIFENDVVKVCDNLGSLTGKIVWCTDQETWLIGSTGIALSEFAPFERQLVSNAYRKETMK
jgi:hypothetical protein